MADDIYVQLTIPDDEQGAIDDGIARLQARWPDYIPEDGDMEVALLEIGGSWYSDLKYGVTQMSAAAFIAFGTKLYGVPFLPGFPATTTITLTVVDDAGYTIPAGSQVEIDGFAFNIAADAVIAPGATVAAGVRVYCAVFAAAANGLTGDTIAQLSLPSFVTDVTVDAATTSGADPMTALDYLSAFSNELRLRAKTIVTTRDFEIEAVEFSQEIGRAVAIGDTARAVAVYIVNPEGAAVSPDTKTALAAHYATFALVNTTFTINDPTYTTVDVAWTGEAVPGVDVTVLQDAGNAALAAALSPTLYGEPVSGRSLTESQSGVGWLADPKIRKNDLVALLKQVPGMLHIDNVTLSASGISADGNGDLTIPGVAPLPQPGAMTGAVTST